MSSSSTLLSSDIAAGTALQTTAMDHPIIIGVGGFSSEVGKTTLLCELIRAFPDSEAIKTTRGHYRSCGKDPHQCCVSHLLDTKAVVRSGRELTYAPGKDTGLYWDAGATNVHWVIATDSQVEEGVKEAIRRVQTEVVFIEGNSFTQTVKPDFFIMVVHPGKTSIKRTARTALTFASSIYISRECGQARPSELLTALANFSQHTPIFLHDDLSELTNMIRHKIEIERQTRVQSAAS